MQKCGLHRNPLRLVYAWPVRNFTKKISRCQFHRGEFHKSHQTYKISLDLIKNFLIICVMDTFTALADPTRRRIIESLAAGETSFGELADKFDMSRPAVSQHLKVLRDAGIVTARADAQRRIYRLNEDSLDELEAWLRKVREFWSHRLDRLEQLLDETD